LARQAAFVFPHLAETTPTETWIGFRPGSDAVHMEAWHSRRLYLAYGHYRNGILLAPVTAKRIAASIDANLQIR
jgi:glycine oxidase